MNIRIYCCRSDMSCHITITWEYQHPCDVDNIIVIVNSVIIWWCKTKGCSYMCVIRMVPYSGGREAENICRFPRIPGDLLARCQYPYGTDTNTFGDFVALGDSHIRCITYSYCKQLVFGEKHDKLRLTLGSYSNIRNQQTTQSIELSFFLMN